MDPDRPNAEDPAAEARAHLSAMFDNAPPLFSVEPSRFALVAFNAAFVHHVRQALGREPRPGMTPEELLPPEAAGRCRELFRRALQDGSFHTEMGIPGGRDMLLTFRRLGRDGSTLGISVLAVEVTESRQAMKALAEAQARLTAIVESTRDPIWSVEPERFGLVTFNTALVDYLKRGSPQDIRAGMTPDELLRPEAAARWCAFYSRALSEGAFVTEYQAESWPEVLLLSVQRMERDGRVFGISVFGKDITERKAAERALAESEARFRSLIEYSPVAIRVSRDFKIEYVNRAYEALFRTSPEATAGLSVIEQWAPESREAFSRAVRQVRVQEGGAEFEGLSVRPDGSVFPTHVSVAMLQQTPVPFHIAFLTDISERKAVEARLQQTLEELRRLRDRLQQDNVTLRREITAQRAEARILGDSPAIRKVLEQARTVAPTDSVVLITGETGTGKELLARAIHEMSPRAARPMLTVNCAALPAGLIESELFGREKGAYTGAEGRAIGRFEAADGSTLFLDEVAELPLELQARLLRVLQDGRFERLGGHQTVSVDVRVIAATNRDLGVLVADGGFRADLYYRLRVFPIEVPPLRARREDIPQLVQDAVRFFSQRMGKSIESIPTETMRRLLEHPWPGNVRELRNLIERSVILSDDGRLTVALEEPGVGQAPPVTLEDVQRRHVLATLERTQWRIGGRDGAAAQLAMQRSTLNSLMKRLGISRPVPKGRRSVNARARGE